MVLRAAPGYYGILGPFLLYLADEIKVNIDLLCVVLFPLPPGAFVHLNPLYEILNRFRIRLLVHQPAEAVSVQERVLTGGDLVPERFRLFLLISLGASSLRSLASMDTRWLSLNTSCRRASP